MTRRPAGARASDLPRPLPIHLLQLPTPFPPVGPVNAYLIDAEPLTLVDCGPRTEETWNALGGALSAVGRRLADVERLVLTHPHQDHAGLAADVRQASGCEVFAHPSDHDLLLDAPGAREALARFRVELCRRAGVPESHRRALERFLAYQWRFGRPLEAVRALAEGDRLPFAGFELRVLHTVGHTRGSVSLWDERGGALVSGDTFLLKVSSNANLEPDRARFRRRSLLDYFATLRRVAGLSVRWLLPGHGATVGGPGSGRDVLRPLVASRLGFHDRRTAEILAALREGHGSPWEVAARVFPDLEPGLVFLGVSEVVGHLDLLAARGEILFEGQEEGTWAIESPEVRGEGT